MLRSNACPNHTTPDISVMSGIAALSGRAVELG
jgi:hypothetical protein